MIISTLKACCEIQMKWNNAYNVQRRPTDLPKWQSKGQEFSTRVTARTYLSDKERARVNDIQEVPEAAIEGCLEKGEERRLDQLP